MKPITYYQRSRELLIDTAFFARYGNCEVPERIMKGGPPSIYTWKYKRLAPEIQELVNAQHKSFTEVLTREVLTLREVVAKCLVEHCAQVPVGNDKRLIWKIWYSLSSQVQFRMSTVLISWRRAEWSKGLSPDARYLDVEPVVREWVREACQRSWRQVTLSQD